MARILILSPGSPCRNPRPVKEATALGAAGHDVTLVTVFESAELRVQEAALVAGAPYRHEVVDADLGPGARQWRRLCRKAAATATGFGFESRWALGQPGPLLHRALAHQADLTIVHNEIAFWVGVALLRSGRRVAADFEDWYSEDLLPADRAHRPLKLIRRLEGELLRRVAYTSTTSAALAAALAARYGGPAPLVLTNSFALQPDPRSGPPGTPPAFFWFSQTIGPGRGLEEFCTAWGRTRQPSRVALLGQVRPGFDEHLRSLVPAAHRPRLEFLPLVPPGELPAMIARHDVGLALEQSFIVNRDLTITNKILQYLNAGLGVLATGTQGQREVLARAPAAGLVVDLGDAESLAAQLDGLVADRSRLTAFGAAARRAAEEVYSWEREAPRLVAQVASALAR